MDHRQSGKQRCCMNQPHQKGMLPDLAAGQKLGQAQLQLPAEGLKQSGVRQTLSRFP